jgi:hypothetical protein
MVCFDLTICQIVVLFTLQSLHLRFGKYDAFFGGFLFKSAQALFHGSRSWRNHMERTPDGEINTPFLRSSLLALT